MSENVIQTSFAAGELAPSIFARTDLATYHQGLATCRNFFVDYRSGVSSRQGSAYVLQCRSFGSRLVSFSVTTSVTYMIEFGDHYCRFYSDGAPVLESPFGISSITNASPAIANVPGHNFVVGDWIFLANTVGMPQVNDRFALVAGVVGNLITLNDVNGNPIDASAFGAYSSGGTASRIYTISSPYAAADLFPNSISGNPGIKFAQSVSVLYITHPSYPPTTLSFAAPTNWFFTTLVFGTLLPAPTGLSLVVTIPVPGTGTTISTTYQYAVTGVDVFGEESLPGLTSQVTVSPATGSGNIASIAGTATISWAAVPGATSYNIFKAEISYTGTIPSGAAFGFVGNCTGTSFIDSNISPDFTTAPPITNNMPFASANNPGAVSFFQQRAYYGGSTKFPASFWASQPGAFQNFNESQPVQASDTITGTIVSNQLNQIRHMLPMPGGLIFLTGRSAYTLTTGQGANSTLAVTPANATLMPQAYNGASDVTPLVINEDILFVQAKGSIVRDLSYNIYVAIYTGTDVSVRSNHLFFQHSIVQWAYAEEPFKLVWTVRDDGILLSLTFMKEQQISGWARHDTQGLFKSVATIQEGQVDAPYFIVQRTLPNGTQVQWIERMAERNLTYGAEDAWAVDAGIRSSLPTPPATITVSAATGTVTITADASIFGSVGAVGAVIRAGGGIITVTGFISPTQLSGIVTQPITQLIQDFPSGIPVPPPFAEGTWSIATPATKFYGLDYLIGQIVSINADGGVVTPQVVASDGSITLASPATKVTAGLGFQCQGQTMPLDVGEPTIQGKRKKIAALNFKFANTRGVKAGRTLQTLMPLKDMNITVPSGSPIPLITGDDRIVMDPLWDVPGQLWFQVDDPLPATVLGVIPEVVIGDTK